MNTEHLPAYVHGTIVSAIPSLICDEWVWVTTDSGEEHLLTWNESGIEKFESPATIDAAA
jgi:hypothetical protein